MQNSYLCKNEILYDFYQKKVDLQKILSSNLDEIVMNKKKYGETLKAKFAPVLIGHTKTPAFLTKTAIDDNSENVERKIKVITFNAMGNLPGKIFSDIFKNDENIDIYVIGIEEIIEMKAKIIASNVLYGNDVSEKWEKMLINFIPKGVDLFKNICSRNMLGLSIFIIARKTILNEISNIEAIDVNLGFLRKIPNKGSLAIKICFLDANIAFIVSHFQAGKDNTTDRNGDYFYTMERLNFKRNKWIDIKTKLVKNCDTLIWIGDLNYRLDLDAKLLNAVFEELKEKKIKKLLLCDQLINAMKNGEVFNIFKEPPINFCPTYKFIPGYEDTYDRPNNEKARMPAWCDRILYYSNRMENLEYTSHQKISTSDHKPVSATFKLSLKSIKNDKFNDFMHDQSIQFEKLKTLLDHKVKISNYQILPPKIYFKHPQKFKIMIENQGYCHLNIKFYVLPTNILKYLNLPSYGAGVTWDKSKFDISVQRRAKYETQWIKVDKGPLMTVGLCCTNEIVVTLDVSTPVLKYVDVYQGNPILSAGLVISINGTDLHVVEIKTEYQRSIMGLPLNFLSQKYHPIRNYNKNLEINKGDIMGVGKELSRIVYHTRKHYKKGLNLFNFSNIDKIAYFELREAIDCGEKLPENLDLSYYIAYLIQFYTNTPKPLLDVNKIINIEFNEKDLNFADLIESMEEIQKINIIFIVTFLTQLIEVDKDILNDILHHFAGCIFQINKNNLDFYYCKRALKKLLNY